MSLHTYEINNTFNFYISFAKCFEIMAHLLSMVIFVRSKLVISTIVWSCFIIDTQANPTSFPIHNNTADLVNPTPTLSSNVKEILCGNLNHCANDTVICPPQNDCIIYCNSTASCHGTNIQCASIGHYCLVICDAEGDACLHTSIEADNGYLTVASITGSEQIMYHSAFNTLTVVSKYGTLSADVGTLTQIQSAICSKCSIEIKNQSISINSPTVNNEFFWADTDDVFFILLFIVVIILALYILIMIFVVSKQNKNYYYPVILFIYIYAKICTFVYSINTFSYHQMLYAIVFLLSLFFLYVLETYRNYYIFKHYYQNNAFKKFIYTTYTEDKFENNYLATALFIVCTICGELLPTLYIFKISLFSIAISKRFLMVLTRTQRYYILCSVFTRLLQLTIVFNNLSGNTLTYLDISLMFLLSFIIIHCMVLWIEMQYVYDWKQNHSLMEMHINFFQSYVGQQLHMFNGKYADYKTITTKMIKTYVKTSKYSIDVININIDDSHLVRLTLSIDWDSRNDMFSDKAMFEMERYLRDKFLDITFSKFVQRYLEHFMFKSVTMPVITIKGRCKIQEIHTDEIKQFEEHNHKLLKRFKESVTEYKPLHSMSKLDIYHVIGYWILNDEKYQLYSKEIMGVIKRKQIDGFTIQQQIEKNINIYLYLNNIIGEYVNKDMLQKIASKLQHHKYYDYDSQEIGKLICMFPIDEISNRWIRYVNTNKLEQNEIQIEPETNIIGMIQHKMKTLSVFCCNKDVSERQTEQKVNEDRVYESIEDEIDEIDEDHMTPMQKLFYFVKQGDIEGIKSISSQVPDINQPDDEGVLRNTAMHYAVQSGSVECVKVLYNLEANEESKNKLKSTPLHIAAALGYTEIAKFLMKMAADMEARNIIGNTPLHCAIYAGHVDTVKAILDRYDADDKREALIHTINCCNYAPAKYCAHEPMKDYLRQVWTKKHHQQNHEHTDVKEEEKNEKTTLLPPSVKYSIATKPNKDKVKSTDNNICDGEWIVTNFNNTKFIDILQDISGIDEIDAIQISKFLKKYHVPSNEKIQLEMVNKLCKKFENMMTWKTVHSAITEKYKINYAHLAVKLKQNVTIDQESVVLMNLIKYILSNTKEQTNYHLINNVYQEFAKVLADYVLEDWWCAECCYHNRAITIFNNQLQKTDKLMQNCLVCGQEKLQSIIKALKCNSKSYSLNSDSLTIEDLKVECKSNEYKTCDNYQRLLNFITNYSNINDSDYVSIISELDFNDATQNIILPAINNLSHDNDRRSLEELFGIVHMEEMKISSLQYEEKMENKDSEFALINYITSGEFSNMLHISTAEFESKLSTENPEVTVGIVSKLYKNITDQMDMFVKKKQVELLGSSYVTATNDWNHVLKMHIDDLDVAAELQCKDLNCLSISRHSLRKSEKNRIIDYEKMSKVVSDNFNENMKQSILIESYYEREFDNIHCNMLHAKHKKHRATLLQKQSTQSPQNHNVYEEEKSFNYLENDNTTMNETISRYTTEMHLYDFGIDYQHQYSGPLKDNTCLRIELLNTGYVSNNVWKSILIKAFQKYKLVVNDSTFRSKQFSDDYNICRGDPISTHHLLSICFYTDFSALCKEYRASYHDKEGKNSHQKFYFLSRFLFITINFHGRVMKHTDTVFHGLNKELLFKKFSAYFNSPMSTTPDEQVAINFAEGRGIILQLRNGNKTINENYIISKFESNQPRFMNVNWISAHNNENEWLFFGESIIFEIVDIKHKQIKRHTLKQLNLLQRIITNKPIEWKKEQKRSIALSHKLQESRKTIQHFDFCDEIDLLQEYLINDANFNDGLVNKFIKWCAFNEYDGEAFMDDIASDKSQSNFYEFLLTRHKQKYFSIVCHVCTKQQEALIAQTKYPYDIKLYHFFCVAQTEFISIQEPFKIPSRLAEQLFIDENNKKSISITNLTDLFYNAKDISFNNLPYATLIKFCELFCQSVINYSMDYSRNKHKKLTFVQFKSLHMANSKPSPLLQECAQKYERKIKNITITYIF
eukprot:546045_1